MTQMTVVTQYTDIKSLAEIFVIVSDPLIEQKSPPISK